MEKRVKGSSKKLAMLVIAGIVALTAVAGSAYAATSGVAFVGSATLAKITTQLTGLGAKVNSYESNESVLLAKINNVRATANDRIGAANALISQIKASLAKSQADKAALDTLLIQMEDKILLLTNQKQELQAEYDMKVDELNVSRGVNAGLRAQVAALGVQINQANNQISTLNGEIATKNATIDALTAQITTLNGQIDTLNDAITALNAQISELEGQNKTLISANTSLQSNLDELNIQHQALLRDFATLHQNVIVISNALAASGQENAAKQTEIDRLSSELNAANQAVQNAGNVSDTVAGQTDGVDPLSDAELNNIETSVDPVVE